MRPPALPLSLLLGAIGDCHGGDRTQAGSVFSAVLEKQRNRQHFQHSGADSAGAGTLGAVDLLDNSICQPGVSRMPSKRSVFRQVLRFDIRGDDRRGGCAVFGAWPFSPRSHCCNFESQEVGLRVAIDMK